MAAKLFPEVGRDAPVHPEGCAKGYIPPTAEQLASVQGMFAPPSEMDVYPESELYDRAKQAWDNEQTLYHLWQIANNGRLPANLYQNGHGLCWSHSSTNGVMVARCAAGMPYKPLSAYMVACLANGYRDQGGWCGQSAKLIHDVGVCEQRLWAQQSFSRSNDTPEMRENAAKHKIQEEWRDLTRPIHGQRMTWQQLATALLNGQPAACDFMWWRHSVCALALVPQSNGNLDLLILNSWGSNWGDRGFGTLSGSRKVPDGAIAIRTVTAT